MLILDGGITLPLPRKVKGFKKPEETSRRRWDDDLEGRWRRAYMHCLYSLHNLFELPLHSVVPRMSKKMLEASDPFNVSLRFLGEMEQAKYIRFDRGMDERIVLPTKKLLRLKLGKEEVSEPIISYPKLLGERIPRAPIRGGVSSSTNRSITRISGAMSNECFEISEFMLGIIKEFPPEFDKISSEYMYHRMLTSAEKFRGKVFRFPYFLCSRSRMYVNTTCGFTPQGADHEKAIIIPVYKEPLTKDGFKALVEAAHGYSEIEWSVEDMAAMARDPRGWKDEWRKADKPYSFLSCANLINIYLSNSSTPIPAFIPLDGRCSGLQHWSAVCRSSAITAHLGMEANEAKLDIYEKVAADWKATLPEDMHCFATRKAAKIPVMTWGYNATVMTSMNHLSKLFGAKMKWDQELAQYIVVGEGLERADSGRLGADLYKRLNETLGPLKEAVDWVSECAVIISKIGNTEIHWPTPDGFEAMQRKVKGERLDLECILDNGARINLEILDFTKEIPNTAKHRSAIAPNIIHGCDATHLRLVANRLHERRRPMIFIHDSFATHCNYRDEMYKDIVETFTEMYSRNYLLDIYNYWVDRYRVELRKPPKMGDWEPSQLINLKRFFT